MSDLQVVSLANKYRPMVLKDLVGNEKAKKLMSGFFETKKLPPTVLFTGGFGQGKTTGSRMLARMVLCETHDVCGTCFGCRTPIEVNPNFKEANMAAEGGVNDARALIEQAKISPLGGGYRIFLLDECFPADTEVLTIDDQGLHGSTRIGDMAEYRGKVATYNTTTLDMDVQNVSDWANMGQKTCVRVTLDSGASQVCSETHKWWSHDRKEMVFAKDLLVGENLLTVTYGTVAVTSVDSEPFTEDLFDITVENDHNFFIRPAGSYEWVLVSNCHRLTGPAASALLKSLEEPSKNTLWMLATNLPEKMLDTLRSRAVRISMEAPTPKEVAGFLARIAKAEGCKVTRERHQAMFEEFGKMGGGHVRNSVMMLQSYLSMSRNGKEDVSTEDVLETYGAMDEQAIENTTLEALVALVMGNSKSLIKHISTLGEMTREFLYRSRFFIDLKIANFAGTAKFYTANHKVFDQKTKELNQTQLILMLNRVQKELIDLEVTFNTVPGLDERIGLQTMLVGMCVQFAAKRSAA